MFRFQTIFSNLNNIEIMPVELCLLRDIYLLSGMNPVMNHFRFPNKVLSVATDNEFNVEYVDNAISVIFNHASLRSVALDVMRTHALAMNLSVDWIGIRLLERCQCPLNFELNLEQFHYLFYAVVESYSLVVERLFISRQPITYYEQRPALGELFKLMIRHHPQISMIIEEITVNGEGDSDPIFNISASSVTRHYLTDMQYIVIDGQMAFENAPISN